MSNNNLLIKYHDLNGVPNYNIIRDSFRNQINYSKTSLLLLSTCDIYSNCISGILVSGDFYFLTCFHILLKNKIYC